MRPFLLGKLSFLGESFPDPSKNRLWQIYGALPQTLLAFLKKRAKNFYLPAAQEIKYSLQKRSFCKSGSKGVTPLVGARG